MIEDTYTYDLEKALERILELVDPSARTYQIETIDGDIVELSEELAKTIDHANDLLYGEGDE